MDNSIQNKKLSSQEYLDLVTNTWRLIIAEIDSVTDVESQYVKLCIMYEFFRMLRGEAFLSAREIDPTHQPLYYKMENELANRLLAIKPKIKDFSRMEYYLHNWLSESLVPDNTQK